jgi:hypothetical protein
MPGVVARAATAEMMSGSDWGGFCWRKVLSRSHYAVIRVYDECAEKL